MSKYSVFHVEKNEFYRKWFSDYSSKKQALADFNATVAEFESDKQLDTFQYAMCELIELTSLGSTTIKHWDDIDGLVEF